MFNSLDLTVTRVWFWVSRQERFRKCCSKSLI